MTTPDQRCGTCRWFYQGVGDEHWCGAVVPEMPWGIRLKRIQVYPHDGAGCTYYTTPVMQKEPSI